MSTKSSDLEQLNVLLERRKNYFLLEGIQRKLYQVQFEKIQKEILYLKLRLGIYYDDLDIFSIRFNYISEDFNSKTAILDKAVENNEIRWLKRTYDPTTWIAEYVGIVRGQITDPWLQEKYLEHMAKRDGYMDCPWPTLLNNE